MPPNNPVHFALFSCCIGFICAILTCTARDNISHAQSPPAIAPEAEVKAVQEQLETERKRSRDLEQQARKLSQELEALRIQLITAAKDMQEREAVIANLELQTKELVVEIERRRSILVDRNKQLAGTLGALTGLSADAPRAFFLYPGKPLEAVQGSILLRSAIPVIGYRARILAQDLAALEDVRQDLASKQDQLGRQDVVLAQDRKRLETLISRKRTLYNKTASQAEATNKRLKKLTEKAVSLKELLEALEVERIERNAEDAARQKATQAAKTAEAAWRESNEPVLQAGPLNDNSQFSSPSILPPDRPGSVRPFPKNSDLTPPSVGVLVQKYGQDTGFGAASKGIVVETLANATVLAPFDGQAVYAGPFKKLGNVLIIKHDGGYHTVLAGFDRIDVGIGHWLLAGEPVGIMPGNNRSATDITGGSDIGENSRPRLYMELRREGQPINPLNWIVAGNIRVNG